MAPTKRGREVIDLTDDAEPRTKNARVPSHGTSSSSQSTAPRQSQGSRDSWSTPSSSLGNSRYPASFQVLNADDDEAIDLTQDDEGPSLELYGTMDTKIVGVRYYNGVATPHELVAVRREPGNPYDENAIRIDNVMGAQIGHLGRKVVEKLAGYVDRNELVLEGVLTGEKGLWDCPMRLFLYGTSHPLTRLRLEERLKADRLLKATQLKQTRKESEARRKATGLQSGTSSAGLATAVCQEQETALQQLVATSETLETQRTDDLTDVFASNEETLKAMPKADQPTILKSQLLPYQLQGLAWMAAREKPQLPAPNSDNSVQLWKRSSATRYTNLATGFISTSAPSLISGGILADDMGLGKTLQIISLVLAEGTDGGPTLIVAPVSVLSNWEQQIRFHVNKDQIPHIVVYHGCKPMSGAELRKFDVVITSYGMVGQESKSSGQRLLAVDWRRVVLDEGHTIRNPKSRVAAAVCNLKAQSRWVLTGTPIINSVRDFLSILRFLKLSGGLEDDGLFSQVITRPMKQLHHSHPDKIKAIKVLGHLMQDLCLRRKKDMMFIDLNLPPKTEYIHRIKFGKSEQIKYDAMMSEAQGELEKYQSKSSHGQKGRYTSILERLLRLRQICNHWALCKDRVDDLLALFEDQKVVALDDKNVPILQQALQLMIDSQEECAICYESISIHEPCITACKHVFGKPCIAKAIEMQGKCPMCRSELQAESLVDPIPETQEEEFEADDTCRSSKTEALVKILEATLHKEGSKVVIFSQWTSFLNIIQMRLKQANLACTRIDGSMAKKHRDAAIESLNTDPKTRILLASLSVCSVGLNLVSADTVVLADSWWAPAIEDQAVDRVHRLGQTRETTVWRLVIEDSIEERVLDIQSEKRQLVSAAFQEKTKGGKAKETRMADISKLLS
ncbi:SNF2 family N-terminal domain-containing protein [Pseudomassariella vexata]|uniref:SNF2 family N-terminal domain-domain-containing protein n=1 Tax=Pseudomassariella vexata TaxID=1141098 RepID=A0A1Y2E0H8_9PEZI|nr:SNF2 family N-terminal domain-containing protein [Pseudomassariella vexata]ORY65041.1 SNF2 family N-terminal domain-domain-containing protein [Pseudomassariella vexata]